MNHSQAELLDNINDIIEDFQIAMLVTVGTDNKLHSRPMSIAKHDEDSGMLHFATSVEADKTDEIKQNPRVNITMQSATQFVSLSGQATIINDRSLINNLFQESWKAWFPDDQAQQNIRLIQFAPEQGEYWDLSGLNGLKFLWKAGKAIMQEESVASDDVETHAQVKM